MLNRESVRQDDLSRGLHPDQLAGVVDLYTKMNAMPNEYVLELL